MAVSLDVADFIGEGGYFNAAELWPGIESDDLSKRFEVWIEKTSESAEVLALATDALQEDAITKRVMYRGWDNIYQLRLGNPASVTVDQKGSHGFTQGQIDAARAERDAALATYEEAVAVEETAPAVPVLRQSASVPIQFTF